MLNDLKTRAQVRKILIFLNIGLGVVLSSLLIYWLTVLRPNQIDVATSQKQYGYYNINNLPFNSGEVENNYFGKTPGKPGGSSIVAGDDSEDLSSLSQEELLRRSEILLSKTNNLLQNGSSAEKSNTENPASKDEVSNQVKNSQSQASTSTKHPKIALLITNLGLNRRSTELALTLPAECALGFLPYTKTLKPLLHKAQSNGHEVYIYLPLQTAKDAENPGKYALTTDLAPEEVTIRLNVILNAQSKFDGVYSSYKETFTDNIQASSVVFDQIEDRNLLFVMGKGKAGKVAKHFQTHGKMIVPADLILDEEADRKAINAKLEALANLAEKNGVAVGYSQGFTLTIEVIRDWLPLIKKRGIVVVPISTILEGNKSE